MISAGAESTAVTPANAAGVHPRLQDVDELLALLGPGRWLIMPSRRAPRLLVPAGPARATAHAVLRHGVHPSRRQRWQRRALATVLHAGAGARLFASVGADGQPEDALLHHLQQVLGRALVAAAPLSAPRANRKPVLHLMDTAGKTVGYAKVGVNALTNELVRHEAAVLRQLASWSHPAFDAPAVIHHERWRGREVLVTAPVAAHEGAEPRPAQLDRAMQQLARSASGGSGAQTYLRSLAQNARSASCPAGRSAVRDTLLEMLAAAQAEAEHVELRTGPWHGDWTAWNCATVDGRLVVWDWERCREPVPHGFDALHYRLQAGLLGGPATSWPQLATTCVTEAGSLLGPWGIGTAAARMTALLYLIDLGLRYVLDDQASAGGRAGDVEAWLMPVLDRALSRPGKELSE